MNTKNIVMNVASLALLCVTVWAALAYFPLDELVGYARFDLAGVVLFSVAVGCYGLSLWAGGGNLYCLARVYGVRIGFMEALFVPAVSLLANYALPFVGSVGIRVMYLKKRYGLDAMSFAPLSLVGVFLGVCVYVGIALTGLLVSPLEGAIHGTLVSLYGGFFVGALLFVLLPADAWKGVLSMRLVHKLFSGWVMLRRKPVILSGWMGFIVVRAMFDSLALLFVCSYCGVTLSFPQALVVGLSRECSMLVKLTPGSLGVTESIVLVGLMSYGVASDAAVMVGVLTRVASFIPVLVFGVASYVYMGSVVRR